MSELDEDVASRRPDLVHPFKAEPGYRFCMHYHQWLGGKVRCGLSENSPLHRLPAPPPTAPEKGSLRMKDGDYIDKKPRDMTDEDLGNLANLPASRYPITFERGLRAALDRLSAAKQRRDDLLWCLSRMSRGYDQMTRRRDSDSPAQRMVDEAAKLLEGYDEDAETERRATAPEKE